MHAAKGLGALCGECRGSTAAGVATAANPCRPHPILAFPLGVSRSDGRGEKGNMKASAPHQSANAASFPRGGSRGKTEGTPLSLHPYLPP